MLYSSGNRGIQHQEDYDRFVTLFKQQSASKKNWMTARYEMTKAGLEGKTNAK
jgi:hypothetical protein